MRVLKTTIQGVFVIEPRVIEDSRGYFMESYNLNSLIEFKIVNNFIQDNESHSRKGVLRGLHYQTGDFSQAKLVRVISGEVKDIIVDLRENSPFYGKSYSIILSGQNKKQLLVPRGFAHGFIILSETAIFSYKCDNPYHKESEVSIYPLCSELNLDWGMKPEDVILSKKDKTGVKFGDHPSSGVVFKA